MFILPSLLADLSVVMYNSECKRVSVSYGAAVAAAAFLVKFRGLPLDTVEVEMDKGIESVNFCKAGNISILLPKCKQLLEKSRIFQGEIKKTVKIISVKSHAKTAAVIHCDDADLFREAHLGELLFDCEAADFAVAFSYGDRGIKTKCHSTLFMPDLQLLSSLAAFEYTCERKKQLYCEGSEDLTLSPAHSGIKVSIPVPRLMCFSTPYL